MRAATVMSLVPARSEDHQAQKSEAGVKSLRRGSRDSSEEVSPKLEFICQARSEADISLAYRLARPRPEGEGCAEVSYARLPPRRGGFARVVT